MISKDAIADVVEQIRGTDFYRPAHEVVYDAIIDLYGRGEPADAITVADELTKRGEIQRIGGAPYLHTLISSVPTAANAGYYARIVRERSVLRKLVEAGTRIVQLGYGTDGGDVDEIVNNAQAEVYAVTERRSSEDYLILGDIIGGAVDEIEAAGHRGEGMIGVPTGFSDLDRLTNGLHPGPDDRARRPPRHRQGPRARHASAHAVRLDDHGRGPGRRPAARRRRDADARRRRHRRARRAADLPRDVRRRQRDRRRRPPPVGDQHPRRAPTERAASRPIRTTEEIHASVRVRDRRRRAPTTPSTTATALRCPRRTSRSTRTHSACGSATATRLRAVHAARPRDRDADRGPRPRRTSHRSRIPAPPGRTRSSCRSPRSLSAAAWSAVWRLCRSARRSAPAAGPAAASVEGADGPGACADLPRLRRRDDRTPPVPAVPRRERDRPRSASYARRPGQQAHPVEIPPCERAAAARPARRASRHRRHRQPDRLAADRTHEPAVGRGRPRARPLARVPDRLVDQAGRRPDRGLVDRVHADVHDG